MAKIVYYLVAQLETQPVDTKEKAKENDSCASSSGTDCDSLRSLVTASERDDDEGDGDESDASADGGDDDGGESSLGSFVDGGTRVIPVGLSIVLSITEQGDM